MIRNRQTGFTAVELLITLFVAAAFLIASYQLYSVIIRDGGNARAESRAANVALDYLRQYSSAAANPCVAYSPLIESPITVDSLTNASVSVTVTCPNYSTTEISKVDVSVSYDVPQKTVTQSSLVTGTSGSPDGEILDGLAGWWKLNGNAQSSVGSLHGTIVGATPTANMFGVNGQAYSFNGTNNAVSFTNSIVPAATSSFTVSVWVNRSRNNASYEEMMSQWTNATSGSAFYFGFINSNMRFSDSWPDVAVSGAGTTGQWMHLVGVNDATNNNAYIYRNGILAATRGSRLAFTGTGPLYFGRQGEYAGGAEWIQGSLDDIRVYRRALSTTEIGTLYTRGPQ